jgi:hypothetical protein
MDKTYIIIFILTTIIVFYIVKNYYLNILISKYVENIEKLEYEINEYKIKFENLISEIYNLERKSFNNGFIEGQEKNKITVKIEPIENITNSNFWILKKESIEIGFEYQLFINNIPTEFKSTHILRTLKKSEINEENIKKIINGIEQIESLSNVNFVISNSIKIVKNNLIKQLTKK